MYPAKSNPAVPSKFRTNLSVFIILPFTPIFRLVSMRLFCDRFHANGIPIAVGYASIAWAIVGRHDRACSDPPVFGKIPIYVFCQYITKIRLEIH
jgi:hypothetical protein